MLNILAAEDNCGIQEAIKAMMVFWNYKVDIVSNGKEAVKKTRANHYDLCLMDIEMPVMNGREATRQIRRESRYIPILALSGNPQYKDECLEVGVDDFMNKPCTPDELHEKIIELTVKRYIIQRIENQTTIKKEMPMDVEHAKELRELEKLGLCKMSLRGALTEVTMVVHKNVPQKISHDFIGNDKQLSVFLDRSDEKPGECYLYRINFMLNTRFLSQEKFEEKMKTEEESLKDCNTFAEKKKET